jgi:hypothetical protein
MLVSHETTGGVVNLTTHIAVPDAPVAGECNGQGLDLAQRIPEVPHAKIAAAGASTGG